MARLQIVVGGQYGSEGKGAIAAHLCKDRTDLLAVRVGGPNAGHTVIGRCPPSCPERSTPDGIGAHHADRHPHRLRQVPVAAVTAPSAQLLLAAGSEVDPVVLDQEVASLDSAGYDVSSRIRVHWSATVIEPHHIALESGHSGALVERIGSTGKGIGAARSSRLMRNAAQAADVPVLRSYCSNGEVPDPQDALIAGQSVLIEGTQGYGLGLHAGHYPYTTSSDCTAVDFCAMAGVVPWSKGLRPEIWVVFRPYPIRVAGPSGHLRDETTWADLGLDPELTTVTRKVRRVGHWDPDLASRALRANGHPYSSLRVALTMLDHVVPAVRDLEHLESDASYADDLRLFQEHIEKDLSHGIDLFGTGPSTVAKPPSWSTEDFDA